jgi:protein-tyrosine phosphatase
MPEPAAVLPAWHVAVDGCTNFRDAGGWPIADGRRMRTRRLYRADDPVRLTPAGRVTVEQLGLGFVVDIRQQSQFERGPGFLAPERTAHIPLVDRVIDPANPPTLETAADIADLYAGMLDRSRQPFARAVDTVAAHLGEGPVLVHCVYGKDRAGLVSALVQAAIGVPAEAIIEDYTRSHEPSLRRRAWMLAEPLEGDLNSSRVSEFLFTAPAGAMRLVLDRALAEHRTLPDWVASFPIRSDTIARLCDALLER